MSEEGVSGAEGPWIVDIRRDKSTPSIQESGPAINISLKNLVPTPLDITDDDIICQNMYSGYQIF